MTSIDCISCSENMYLIEQDPPLLNEEEAPVVAERTGAGEGMTKLRAEELGIQKKIMQRQLRFDQIKEIALNISYFSYKPGYLSVLETMAKKDYPLAKAIVDSWDYEFQRLPGYLVLSQWVSDEEAAELFKKIKEESWDFSLLWKVQQEEKRRNFPEASETLNELFERINYQKVGVYGLCESDFALIDFAYRYHLPHRDILLSNFLEAIRSESYFNHCMLTSYLEKMSGWPTEVSHIVCEAFKERLKYESVEDQINLWRELLKFEGTHPAFQEAFQKDLAEVFQMIEENVEEDIEYEVIHLIKKIAPIVPQEAERFLVFLDRISSWYWIEGKVAVFMAQAQDPTFDKQGEFWKLEKEIQPYLSRYESDDGIHLFGAAYAAFGEEALPYLYEGIKGLKRENPAELVVRGARDFSRECRKDWGSFWGIPTESTPVDVKEGTLFSELDDWELGLILEYLIPTQFKEKEMAIEALLQLHRNSPLYDDELYTLLQAQLTLL